MHFREGTSGATNAVKPLTEFLKILHLPVFEVA